MIDLGVIFDFNGTMFFDGAYHNRAWQLCAADLAMREITEQEVKAWIVGRTPKEILEHFLGYSLTDSMVHQFSMEKERIYRSLLVKENLLTKEKKKPELAPGLETFLNYLRNAQIPLAIASTADVQNMTLYYDMFQLERWFEWDRILIPDGKMKMKPEPDLYQAAIRKVKIRPEHCLAFEDSGAGRESAYQAGIRHIVAVTGDSWNTGLMHEPGVIASIRDFTELNEKNFK